MVWTSTEVAAWATSWLWPFFRIGAMLAVTPLFSARYVPVRVRLGLAAALTIVVAPTITATPSVAPFSAEGLLITLQQVLIGVLMGLALRLVFTVFELAGQIVAQLMALHFASLVDPNSGVQVPMLSQFYLVLATLAFLALNGHLLCIEVLAESFEIIPVGVHGMGRDGFWSLVLQGGWIFSAAVLFALPVVAALLIVNLAFGVMTRAAPQLNIFAVGFPITMIIGFSLMLVTLPGVSAQFEQLFSDAIAYLRALLGSSS
ncbi:MAG: flagellar biosynthetic protein FliR [Gammaproteobacteria bacterium]|nr:flagellar biosynthetic protein FliR [Gammaproteobacteria bacterium]